MLFNGKVQEQDYPPLGNPARASGIPLLSPPSSPAISAIEPFFFLPVALVATVAVVAVIRVAITRRVPVHLVQNDANDTGPQPVQYRDDLCNALLNDVIRIRRLFAR